MSHQARYRDIAALLARGVVRVKANDGSQDQVDSATPMQQGGNQ
jgi:hypothetical protein